ncbi:magnesium and cobalt transport protein CorA [Streptomyces sp. NPDC059637]
MECAIYEGQDGTGTGTGRMSRPDAAQGCESVLKRLRGLGGDAFGWVRLDNPSAGELEQLGEGLGLHPLAVEDALQPQQRPKRERYADGVLAVALRTLWYVGETSDVEVGQVMVFLGPRFVVTVRHGRADPAAEAARRLGADPAPLAFGPAGVLHAVLDVVVDSYGTAARQVGADLTALERRVFSPEREDVIEEVYSLKREVLEFRDTVQPLLPVAEEFAGPRTGWPEEALPYFRDVADHLQRTSNEVRALDELLNSVLDAHLARVGAWQNDDMRTISAWAAIFALPTLVAGVYGMNFEHIPEAEWDYGYPAAIGLMAGACFLLYRLFRRNGWL